MEENLSVTALPRRNDTSNVCRVGLAPHCLAEFYTSALTGCEKTPNPNGSLFFFFLYSLFIGVNENTRWKTKFS